MTNAVQQSQGRPPMTFRGVQALRGLAAVMVVSLHATQYWSQRVGGHAPAMVWGNGASGVDIFFVISGFVMAVSTIGRDNGAAPARTFLQRRLIRIAPLYWLATSLVLVKSVAVNLHPELANNDEHAVISLAYIVSSFLFVPYRNSLGNVEPVLNVGWTLSFEMFFYILFAVAIAFRVRLAAWLAAAMIALVALGVGIQFVLNHYAPGESLPAIATLMNPILLEFLAGLLLGCAVVGGRRLNLSFCSGVGIAGLGVLLLVPWTLEPHIRALEWGIPAVCIVAAAVSMEERYGHIWPGWALKLGDTSYSLYLFHLLILALVAKVLIRTPFVTPGLVRRQDEILTVAIVLSVCIPGSLLIYRFVERPIQGALKRWTAAREHLVRFDGLVQRPRR